MKTSANGRAMIEAFEGLFLHAYHDSVGVLTLGFGHTNLGNIPPHINPGDVWTKEQADQALSNDISRFDARVTTLLPNLTQSQHDAMTSFDFNTGDLAHSSIPYKLQAGDTAGAMETLLQYCHAGGKELAGLVRRRRAERLMFLGHVDDALALAGAHTVIINASGGVPNEHYMARAGTAASNA